MTNTNCEENRHRYGLWRMNNEMNLGTRECQDCHHEEFFPLNINILDEIKKQEKAKKIILNWISLPNDSIITLGGIYAILDNQLNYLDSKIIELLTNKIKQIALSDNTSIENAEYLNYFVNYIQSNNQEEHEEEQFYQKVDEFYERNQETFRTIFQTPQNIQKKAA